MKHFVALLFVALVAIAPAHAALVYDGYATGPGGLSTPYPLGDNPQVYAGLLEANLGTPTLVMSADYNARVAVGDVQTLHIYTYADVKNGAPVKFSAAQYARAGAILHNYFPMDQLQNSTIQTYAEIWGIETLAFVNTQIWDLTSSTSCPIWWSSCFGYDTYNWSASMLVAQGVDTYLIPINTKQVTLVGNTVNATMTSTPLPPAFWLLGSGLIGLVGVARKRRLH